MTMNTTELEPSGFAALRKWNPTIRHHHMPRWFIRCLRSTVNNPHLWRQRGPLNFLPSLFDHWGSVTIEGHAERLVYAMPYGSSTDAAQAFADDHGMVLLSVTTPAPWHPLTTCFLFAPNPSDQ